MVHLVHYSKLEGLGDLLRLEEPLVAQLVHRSELGGRGGLLRPEELFEGLLNPYF